MRQVSFRVQAPRHPAHSGLRCLFCRSMLKADKPKVFAYAPELKTLGDHVRARRLDLGLFQKDVAELVGVSTDTVTNWEKNRSEPERASKSS